jgi:iron(III) transport system permease protein
MDGGRLNNAPHSAWHPGPWLAIAVIVVLICGGFPLASLVIAALADLPAAGAALLSPRTAMLLMNTVRLGLVVAVLAGGIGTALGILLSKTDLPGRRMLMALLTFPLFLPPYLLALGWFTVLGRQGLVAGMLGPLAGAATSDAFFGLGGASLVLTVAYTPIVLHLARIGLTSIDPATEEAARLRFRWPPIVRRIHLPLIAPAVVLGMLLTLILVVGEFGVPAYVRYPVFSGAVFTQFAAFLDIRAAVVTSIPLAVLVLGGVAAERYWLRARVQFLGRMRTVAVAAPLGAWRTVATTGAWMYALITVVLPLAGLAIDAGGAVNYLAALRGAGASVVESLWTAAVAASLITATGLLLAYLVERTARGRRNVLDTALLLLFATPGTVLGVALILMWNRAGLTYVYGSVGIILIGYVAHYTPLAARAIGVSLQTISRNVEEAAQIGNVSWTRTVIRVLLPLLAPAIAGAWALAFIFCVRDLDLVMTVHPPGVETLPIRLYTLMANTASSVTAALGVIMVMLTAACVVAVGAALAVVRRSSAWI